MHLYELCTLTCLCVFLCAYLFKSEICVAPQSLLVFYFFKEQNWVSFLSSLIICESSLWVNVVASFTALHLFISSSLHKAPHLHLTWYSLVGGFMAAPALVAQCLGLKATSPLLPTLGWSFTWQYPQVVQMFFHSPYRDLREHQMTFSSLSKQLEEICEKEWVRETVAKCLY